MKKLALVCGLLAMIAFIGCDDDKNTNGGGGGGGSNTGVITAVPAGQNSAIGADCVYEQFVEFCDGNKAIYCDMDYNTGKDVVMAADCKSACAMTPSGVLNYAGCTDYLEACTKEGDLRYVCDVDEFDTLGQYTLKCQKWTDGKLYWYSIDSKPCTECTDAANGCIQQTCTGNEAVCTDEVTGHECYDGMLYTIKCDAYDIEAMCDDEDGVFCY